MTPPVDLSASANAAVRWANDFIEAGYGSHAYVDVTTDGGTTWTTVWQAASDVPGPGTLTADMSFASGKANVQARFHYQSAWAWWWQVDDVTVGPFACAVLPGGLVVGIVSDANTGLGVNGATVTNLADDSSATTVVAPGQGDGFYSLFAAGSGSIGFEASAAFHTALTKNATVATDAVVRLDFSLAAGILSAGPRPLSVVVSPGGSQSLILDVTNTGTGDGSFVLHEVDLAPPAQPAGSRPAFVLGLEDRRALRQQFTLAPLDGRAARLGLPQVPANVPQAAGAGNVVSSFSTGLVSGWGLAYDTDASRLWVSNSDAPRAGFNGDGLDYEYQPDGTPTGETIALQSGLWAGDGTYNARTGMIWQTNVAYLTTSPAQCIFEIDPVAKTVTGKQICGPWGNFPPVSSLAYDYATDTYYAGDELGGITHIDNAGNVLDSGYVPGVQIRGLAYNPTTRHLYLDSFSSPFSVYVVDPGSNYSVLSGFPVTSGGVPVLTNRGVSLEADCLGHLWVYDVFDNKVYEVESGETGWCVTDIPWLSEDPASGTVAGSGGGSRPAGSGNTVPVTVTFDAAGLLPGLRLRSLVFTTDTQAPVAPVPVDFTVLFDDVPQDSFAANFIYGAAGAGVMPGCAPQAPAVRLLPGGGRDAPQHGGLHRARGARRSRAAARLPGGIRRRAARQLQRRLHPGAGGGPHHRGLRRRAAALLPGRSRHAGADGRLRVEGPARFGGAAAVHATGNLRRRAVPGRLRGGLHRGHRRRGHHGRLRQRELLPEREHHERADGGVPREGVQHSVPAVAGIGRRKHEGRRRSGALFPAVETRYSTLPGRTVPSFSARAWSARAAA